MLKQLLEGLQSVESIEDSFDRVRHRASTVPTNAQELKELISLLTFMLDTKKYQGIDMVQFERQVANSKQVLVESDDYYYI